MKLDRPFQKQQDDLDCGPTLLYLAAQWASTNTSYDKVKVSTGYQEGEAMSTPQLALGASELGLNPKLYTADIGFDETRYTDDSYYADNASSDQVAGAIQRLQESDVTVVEDTVALDTLLSWAESSFTIVLLNWNIIRGGKGYHGHYVSISG